MPTASCRFPTIRSFRLSKDGIGVDVTPAMLNVVNAAVEKAYKGERKIAWMEITPARSRLMSMAKVPGCRPKPWISFVNTAWPSRAR